MLTNRVSGPIGLETRANNDGASFGPIYDKNPSFDVLFLQPTPGALVYTFAEGDEKTMGKTNLGTFTFTQDQEFTIKAPFDIVCKLTDSEYHKFSLGGFKNLRYGRELDVDP